MSDHLITVSNIQTIVTAIKNKLTALAGTIPSVDSTLTQTGQAADAKKVGDEIDGKIDADGTDQVTAKNMQIVDKIYSPNLIDESAITDNTYITKDGTTNSGNYFVTDYIPVDGGEQYCGKWTYTNPSTGNTILYDLDIRFLACYDSDKQIMANAGSDTKISSYPYTIPTGVSYVRLSIGNSDVFSKYQFEKGTESTDYTPYGTVLGAVINDDYLPPLSVDMSDIPAFELVDGQNLFNRNDSDFLTGKYISKEGTISSSDAYVATGYIQVSAGDVLLGSYRAVSGNTSLATLAFVACYDSSKNIVSSAGVNSGTTHIFNVPNGVSFVRVSIRQASFTGELQIEKTTSNFPKPYKAYVLPHYEVKDDFLAKGKAPLHVYLPSEIYVAIDRTIEFYNEQIVVDHEKYHFRWVCGKGSATKRKFSITGTTAENLNLDLYLYDDELNVCWAGRCVVHVVAASNPVKKILPIGDSLTNWKAWLQETMLLSGNNITFVGTRYSGQSVDSEGNTYANGEIHHEGRSGFSASDYLSNASYTFDDRYDGVSSVSGSANPFWDGSKFSLSHYLTTQTGVTTPDAVQIFLGTNDIRNGIETATANIAAIAQTIRNEYPNMPIFICNTIYNANQNGYGSVGADAYSGGSGANAWQYNEDIKVQELMKGLYDALKDVTYLYFIPLATCMDREYNFGQVMKKVNPRSSVEIAMPVERIHPQAPGYYQMADLMYSFYCGLLS